MTVEANAKVNLTLEVYGRRPDGYHALRSLVAPISLADTLDFEPAEAFSTDTGYPDDLILKAVRALSDSWTRLSQSRQAVDVRLRSTRLGQTHPRGVEPLGASHFSKFRIRVTKRIPVGGGLGGGSADAAATLRALNELWHLGRTPEELAQIGAAVGSDVPALVLAQHYRTIVLMEGRGEKVTIPRSPFPVPCSPHLVLSNPGIPVSTAEVYRLCAARTEPTEERVNDLQDPAVRLHPEIGDTLAALKSAGTTDVMMSGSGSTVFGFAPDEESAKSIAAKLTVKGLKSWPAKIIANH